MTKRIAPIRMPSAIPMRAREASPTSERARVRTRGPIRLYDQSRADESGGPTKISLKALMDRVRADSNGCALTIVVHGWDSEPTRAFLSLILELFHERSLQEEDAIWLVQGGDKDTLVSPSMEGAVLLSLSSDTESFANNDHRIYNNLVGDVVFFSASEAVEADFAASCRERARTIVINREGEHKGLIWKEVKDARLIVWLWSGSQILTEYSGIEEIPSVAEGADVKSKVDLEEICEALKNKAIDLEAEHNRRLELRSWIEKMLEKYPGRATWNADLIELADRCNWPRWTAESLPSLYVRTENLPEGGAVAFVWHHIRDCIPVDQEDRVEREMWSGEFYEICMTAATAQIADSVAGLFERHLGNLPYPSQRAFTGATNDAMQDVELFLQDSYPETAAKIHELREKIIKGVLSGR
jgi:hypothetical protein